MQRIETSIISFLLLCCMNWAPFARWPRHTFWQLVWRPWVRVGHHDRGRLCGPVGKFVTFLSFPRVQQWNLRFEDWTSHLSNTNRRSANCALLPPVIRPYHQSNTKRWFDRIQSAILGAIEHVTCVISVWVNFARTRNIHCFKLCIYTLYASYTWYTKKGSIKYHTSLSRVL